MKYVNVADTATAHLRLDFVTRTSNPGIKTAVSGCELCSSCTVVFGWTLAGSHISIDLNFNFTAIRMALSKTSQCCADSVVITV
jgi:hypothetical protein